jgi:hypothetical protein
MKKVATFFLFFLCPFIALHAGLNIEGTYCGKGYDPTDNSSYKTEVTIEKNGPDVYLVTWTFHHKHGDTFDIGFGVLKDRQLSISFESLSTPSYSGVQVYEIEKSGEKIHGPWIYYGSTEKGYEKLNKK